MSRRNRKGRKGRILGFLITAGVLGLIFKPSNLITIGLVGAVAFVVGKVSGIMSSGLDTTTHNRQDKPQREMEQLAQTSTGDENADSIITKGQEMLRQIRAENDAIPDQTLTAQMYELENLCLQIFKTVAEKPAKAAQIRKFMNYYLPTTLKMLANYRTMQNRGVSRSELTNARETLTRGMDMVLTACQKQLDNLYKADMLDISTDIDVLEQMLKRDGFADGGLGNIPTDGAFPDPFGMQQQAPAQPAQPAQQPRTAASAVAQGKTPRPTLHVDADGDGVDDFQSFYQKR